MRVLLAVLLLMAAVSARADPAPIPDFTPNVVDPGHVLDAAGKERVNAEIRRIRTASKIWGAVYIVDTLGDESIEELAVRAFETWKLGQAGVDNGLLLVLAMKDRKSRFEVGYGLEGAITDVAALHALDAYLAPKMREGDTAGAIVDAFGYLSRVVEQDPAAVRELAEVSDRSSAIGEEEDWGRGLRAWGLFVIPIWLAAPLRGAWVGARRRRLFEENPVLAMRSKDDRVANAEAGGGSWKQTVGISAFLTLNPGIFVFILSSLEPVIFWVSIVAPVIIVLLIIFFSGRKYGSPERFQKHLDGVAKQRAELMSKGHLVQDAAGTYRYTPAYHASRRSSSSSSSSSRSSSSGGGRSGGGGASSSW